MMLKPRFFLSTALSLVCAALSTATADDVLTWVGGKKAKWTLDSPLGWAEAQTFTAGSSVLFNTKGSVTIAGEVAPADIVVDIAKALAFKTSYNKKTSTYSGAITGEASLTKRGNATLTLNQFNTYSGGTWLEAGTLKATSATSFGSGDITLQGGTLHLNSKAIGNDINLDGVAAATKGKNYRGVFTLQSGELLKGSLLNIRDEATLLGGTISGTLSGAGSVRVCGEVAISTTGKLTVDELLIEDRLTASSKGLQMNAKSSVITIDAASFISAGKVSAYSLQMTDGSAELLGEKSAALTLKDVLHIRKGSDLLLNGKLSSGSLILTDSTLRLRAAAPQSVSIKNDAVIHNSDMQVNGKMTVGNLGMEHATLYLTDVSAKHKAQNLTCKGMLHLAEGASISLNGKLTTKDLKVSSYSHASLNFTSTKFSTITVNNSLTIFGTLDLNLCCDLQPGKEVKLFTFKTFAGDSSHLLTLLGLEDAGVELKLNKKHISMEIVDVKQWDAYVAENLEEWEETIPEQVLASTPAPLTASIEPLLAKAADALVQSTWGTVGASRAFGETIDTHGRNATLLDDGKGAAWLSLMGGSSRISSEEGHNGADFTLSGAAFGVEGRVGEKSTLGVAIGNSWGKVSTFSAFPVDQDSMHVGIYGNHTLTKSLTLSWIATHTRTESDATILGAPYNWSQDALQLNARLSWGKSISEKTAVSAFAGLQYLTTDSGECAGLKTGSLQNLRAELGVGASHKCSDSTMVFGELSFIGDMVRNNPTATIGDYSTHGTPPGRMGVNLSVGAQHRLSEDWSVNASYSLELMENCTGHSLNVGASYSF